MMKHFLLSGLFLLLLSPVRAQRGPVQPGYSPNMQQPVRSGQQMLWPRSFASLGSGGLDCPYLLYQAPLGGYISGNNNYGDLQVAQAYDPASYWEHGFSGNIQIDSVAVLFLKKQVSNHPGPIRLNIYSGDLSLGPQTLLGSSDTLNVGMADTLGGYTFFHFTSPVAVNGLFFCALQLSTHQFDQSAVATSTNHCTDLPGYAWDQWSNQTYHAMSDPLDWGLQSDLAIFPFVRYDSSFVLRNNTLAENSVSIFPNPASSVLHLSAPSGNLSRLEIYSPEGVQLLVLPLRGITAADIPIANLPDGLYVLAVQSANGRSYRPFIKAGQ